MSENRRRILVSIATDRDFYAVGIPRTLADRELQELEALGLVTERPFSLTEYATQLVDAANIVVDGVPWRT